MLNYIKSDSNIVEDGEQLHFYMGKSHTNADYDVIEDNILIHLKVSHSSYRFHRFFLKVLPRKGETVCFNCVERWHLELREILLKLVLEKETPAGIL